MKKILYITILCFFAFYNLIKAQDLSTEGKYNFNKDVLNTINSYETFCTLHEGYKQYFIELFENENLNIYNDLIALSEKEYLSVNEYADLLSKCTTQEVVIKNICKKKTYFQSGRWIMNVTFQKFIKFNQPFSEKYGIELSSQYFETDYNLEACIAWDSTAHLCKFLSITGELRTKKSHIPIKHKAFIYNDKRDKDLLCDGYPITLPSNKQLILDKKSILTYPKDEDMRLIEFPVDSGVDIRDMFYIKYFPMNRRIKAHIDYSLGDVYYTKLCLNNIKYSSQGYNFGIDLGYIFLTKEHIKLGIYSGIGISQSNLKLNLGTLNCSYETYGEADIDADVYRRYYEISDFSNNLEILDITVPTYIGLDYKLTNKWLLYTEIGLKSYFNVKNKITKKSGNYTTYGIYPKYDNLFLDYNAIPDFNQFVNNAEINSSVMSTNNLQIKSYSLDYLVNIGSRYKISSCKPIFLELGLQCCQSIIDPFKKNLLCMPEDFSSYTVNEGEKINPLTNYINGLKRKSFNLNVGVILKY